MAAYSFQKDPWSGVTSRNGIPADELTSMLRGAIRRGEEKTALAAAYEMYLTSPQLLDRAWRSLLSASVEDVGFGAPEAPETVWALYGMRRSFDYTDGRFFWFMLSAVCAGAGRTAPAASRHICWQRGLRRDTSRRCPTMPMTCTLYRAGSWAGESFISWKRPARCLPSWRAAG